MNLGRLHDGGDIGVHLKDKQQPIMWRKGISGNCFPTHYACDSVKLLHCWLLVLSPEVVGPRNLYLTQHYDSDTGWQWWGGNLTLKIVPHDFLVTLVLSRVWMSGEVLFQLESIHWFIVYQDPGIEEKGRRTNSLPLCVPSYPLSWMRKQTQKGSMTPPRCTA